MTPNDPTNDLMNDPMCVGTCPKFEKFRKNFDFWQSMISYWWILIRITIPDWLMQYFRYQTLVQSQSRDLGLLRKQLEQSRLTTHKLRGIIEDLTRSDQLIDQRRFIQLARRTIRKLEGKIWPLFDLDLQMTLTAWPHLTFQVNLKTEANLPHLNVIPILILRKKKIIISNLEFYQLFWKLKIWWTKCAKSKTSEIQNHSDQIFQIQLWVWTT